jgi:hypothetical protein
MESWRSGWQGGSNREAYDTARKGDMKFVPGANAIIAKHLSEIDISSLTTKWELSPVGAFPCIPAYLAGEPENMFQQHVVTHNTAPVRVFVCGTSSGGIGAEELTKRGIAILAFSMALSQARPVEMWFFQNLQGSGVHLTKLSTQPPVLSELCAVIPSIPFSRGLGYDMQGKLFTGWHGGWSRFGYDLEGCRQLLCATDNDVVVPAIYIGDELTLNPIAWVKRELTRILNLREDLL